MHDCISAHYFKEMFSESLFKIEQIALKQLIWLPSSKTLLSNHLLYAGNLFIFLHSSQFLMDKIKS